MSLTARLTDLKQALDSDLITIDKFEAQKQLILASIVVLAFLGKDSINEVHQKLYGRLSEYATTSSEFEEFGLPKKEACSIGDIKGAHRDISAAENAADLSAMFGMTGQGQQKSVKLSFVFELKKQAELKTLHQSRHLSLKRKAPEPEYVKAKEIHMNLWDATHESCHYKTVD
ncbi:hypothetical protein HDU99_009989, partial [Rhizoclosmatium hyalinum]